jgi:hypothetical protein
VKELELEFRKLLHTVKKGDKEGKKRIEGELESRKEKVLQRHEQELRAV